MLAKLEFKLRGGKSGKRFPTSFGV